MNSDGEDDIPQPEKLPIYKKGKEIFDMVRKITDLIPENDDYLQDVKAFMLSDAAQLTVKIAGAEAAGLYDLKMENAAIIRKAARDLMVQQHSLDMFGFEYVEYYQIVRDLIEEYRLLFIDWVAGFDKWDYIIDRWGLFNPPGIGNRPAITLADAEQTDESITKFYGCNSIAEMRALTADSLGDFENRTAAFMKAENRMANLSPNVDGYLLKESFSNAAINGNLADIPYIIGGTIEDMRGNSKPVADFCLAREEKGGKAFAYQFARPLPGDNAGAFHSSELWFVFHTLGRCWRPFTAGDEPLSPSVNPPAVSSK
jgi:hypothetical protein